MPLALVRLQRPEGRPGDRAPERRRLTSIAGRKRPYRRVTGKGEAGPDRSVDPGGEDAAIHGEVLAADPARCRRREEEARIRDVLRFAEASERDLPEPPFDALRPRLLDTVLVDQPG